MSEKETIQKLVEPIQPCDCSKPYYYVSYSTRDGEVVYKDVEALQQAGKNLWIDIDANFNTGEGYNTTIFQQIANPNCQGILFFMSAQSMTSAQSAKEIAYALSQAVVEKHGKPLAIDIVALEDVSVTDIEQWVEGALYKLYQNEALSAAEQERIVKYRNKYNNKIDDVGTKFDLAEVILKVLKAQEKSFVSWEENAEKRVEKIAESL